MKDELPNSVGSTLLSFAALKFREINVFSKSFYFHDLISRNIFQIGLDYSLFHTIISQVR